MCNGAHHSLSAEGKRRTVGVSTRAQLHVVGRANDDFIARFIGVGVAAERDVAAVGNQGDRAVAGPSMAVKIAAASDTAGFNGQSVTVNLLPVEVERTFGLDAHRAVICAVVDAAVEPQAVAFSVSVVEAECTTPVDVRNVLYFVAGVGQIERTGATSLTPLHRPDLDGRSRSLRDRPINPRVVRAWVGVVTVPAQSQRAS